MTVHFPTPLRLVLCHASDPGAPGFRASRILELVLLGDPALDTEGLGRGLPEELRTRDVWRAHELASAVPLKGLAGLSFSEPPTTPDRAGPWLDEALHTLLVVLVDEALASNGGWLDWLETAVRSTSSERHLLLPVAMDSSAVGRFRRARASFDRIQSLDFVSLGEEAERIDWLALRVLHESIRLVALGAGYRHDWRLALFISHAKRDGLSIARSLRDLIAQNAWLKGFYDARDLRAGRPWDKQLEEAVAESVVLALRTDIYDSRPWCRAEVQWAERYGSPLVLVDARAGLVHAASDLHFETAPSVRIPDGNLVRVFYIALRVTLRMLLFRRCVTELQSAGHLPASPATLLIPVTPSLSAVARACDELAGVSAPARFLCYPDPPLRQGLLEAAQALAERAHAQIITPQQVSR